MGYDGEITSLSFDYGISASTASFLSGLLLACLCARALRLERLRGAGAEESSQSHQPALLQILLFIGLTDAYYAMGWLLLLVAQGYPHLANLPPTPPAVCQLANVITFSGEVSQASWTVVLAWYIGRVLHDGRPAEDWVRPAHPSMRERGLVALPDTDPPAPRVVRPPAQVAWPGSPHRVGRDARFRRSHGHLRAAAGHVVLAIFAARQQHRLERRGSDDADPLRGLRRRAVRNGHVRDGRVRARRVPLAAAGRGKPGARLPSDVLSRCVPGGPARSHEVARRRGGATADGRHSQLRSLHA